MTVEDVDRMLSEYLTNSATILHLEVRAKELRAAATAAADTTAGDLINIAQSWSTDPHGTGVSQPTERAAIMLADGDPGKRSRAMLAEAEKTERRISELKRQCEYVEAWLRALNDKEKTVVHCKAIQHLFWRETGTYMERQFGVAYSVTGLKKIYHYAMDKVYKIATSE